MSTEKDTNRIREINKVLWIILALNFAVSIMKLIVGYTISSASMIADGFHSFSDGSSNIVGLVGTAIAAKPADESHPYGHKKFETFTAIGIALLLFMVSINIIKSGIAKLTHPIIPQVDIYSFIVMIITIAINIFVIVYETKAGKKLHSDILVSDAIHTKSDVYVSLSVILSLIAVKLGYPILDPIISFIISIAIIKAAIEILISSSKVLCDAVVVDPAEVITLVSKIEGVLDCHRVRSRGREDDFSLDLHILVDPLMSVGKAHELHHMIEDEIRKHFSGVHYIDIHIEPIKSDETELG
ncbi:MAG: cation diffusion facilitator family transporter [Tepidanaerobacteraceae bacterium]|nr:cation diffusion facilitator family transporter [Tepidanaerobacteraceae bacterium]